jgi:hypothetical protein
MKQGLYQHYRGNFYQVLGISRHSETLEEMVVYQAFYGDYGLWVRPKNMFEGTVIHEGQECPRFRYLKSIGEDAPKLR